MLAYVLWLTAKGMEGFVIQPFLETVSLGSADIYEANWRLICRGICVYVMYLSDICWRLVVVRVYFKHSTTKLLKREMQNFYTEFLSLYRAF